MGDDLMRLQRRAHRRRRTYAGACGVRPHELDPIQRWSCSVSVYSNSAAPHGVRSTGRLFPFAVDRFRDMEALAGLRSCVRAAAAGSRRSKCFRRTIFATGRGSHRWTGSAIRRPKSTRSIHRPPIQCKAGCCVPSRKPPMRCEGVVTRQMAVSELIWRACGSGDGGFRRGIGRLRSVPYG